MATGKAGDGTIFAMHGGLTHAREINSIRFGGNPILRDSSLTIHRPPSGEL